MCFVSLQTTFVVDEVKQIIQEVCQFIEILYSLNKAPHPGT